MRATLWRFSVVWACIGLLMWWATLPAAADQATVGTSDESWYQVAACAAVACGIEDVAPVPVPTAAPVPVASPTVNPFPAGTLHVGIVAGLEQARSYIKLNLSSLPFDARLQGGTLTLPVADAASGTVRADAAKMQACFMVSEFHGGDAGVVSGPPAPDCTTTAPARLITQQDATSFTVDLARFATRWAGGEPNNGIALLVTDEAKTAPDTWQVAINGKGTSGPQIKADLTFEVPAETEPPLPEQPIFGPAFPPPAPVPLPPAPQPQQQVAAPPVAAPPVGLTTRGFQYAAIFLLPLAALAVSGLLGYSTTRDVVLPDA